MPSALPTSHAFVSYVREDSAQVDTLVTFLEAYGVQVWRDKDQLWPGDEWRIEIRRAIQRNALAFIACFSEASDARDRTYQNEELVLAVEEYRLRRPGIPWIFPVRFGDVPLPPYDLGAGKTLDDLQRTDLFGDTREPNLGRLAASINRVISGRAFPGTGEGTDLPSAKDTGASPTAVISPAARLKQLLRDPTKDIELDDYIGALAEDARKDCLDTTRFPTTSERLTSDSDWEAAQLVIKRCDEYWAVMRSVCETLAVGCAYGTDDQDPIWARAMRTIANTSPQDGGQTMLLDLRTYPRLMALYASSLGAVARGNYSALRAVAIDATYRKDGQNVPVLSVCHVWSPFSGFSWMASAVARHTDGNPATAAEISGFRRDSGSRYTPVSDDLHTRLRGPLRTILRDQDDYDDAFDRVEVLLGVLAEDNAAAQKAQGRYAHGGWIGRYSWRNQWRDRSTFDDVYDELVQAGETWPPLRAGLFAGEFRRADEAFVALKRQVDNVRFRRA